MATISRYLYGSHSSTPNRAINFIRSREDPATIKAEVMAFNKATRGYTDMISTVPGENICIEMKSTSEKMRELLAGRQNPKLKIERIEKKLSELSSEQQSNILENLEPVGNWRVEVVVNVGRDGVYEKVVALNLFNPS